MQTGPVKVGVALYAAVNSSLVGNFWAVAVQMHGAGQYAQNSGFRRRLVRTSPKSVHEKAAQRTAKKSAEFEHGHDSIRNAAHEVIYCVDNKNRGLKECLCATESAIASTISPA